MAKKLINTDVKLGQNTLLLEALESLGIDFPIEESANYTKWNSGKLECRDTVTGSGNTISKAFPIPFISPPTVVPGGSYVSGIGGSARLTYVNIPHSTNASFYIRDINTGAAPDFNAACNYYAVGRWK